MKKLLLLISILSFHIASSQCFWAKPFGGPNDESGTSMVTDAAGNVYTTGYFRNTVDFDPGAGVANLSSGWYGAFILKLDGDGNYVWAKAVSSIYYAVGNAIGFDQAGNIYIAGYF